MNNIIAVGLIGVASGGAIAAILWTIEKVRGRPLVEEPSEPMTRDDMIARLKAMANDPAASLKDRARAAARLRAFERLES